MAFRVSLILALLLPAANALGQITFEFTESDTGGVLVRGTGSGTVVTPSNTSIWSALNFDSNFISSSHASYSVLFADSVSGNFYSYGRRTRRESISYFAIDRDTNSGDDVHWLSGFSRRDRLRFNNGDRFELDLNAEFSASSIQFDDLVAGTYSSYSDYFGDVNVVVVSSVPEPGTLTMSGIAILGGFFYTRRRRKKKKTRSESENNDSLSNEPQGE